MDAALALLVRIGEIISEREDYLELNLNPVIAAPGGVTVVDALIVTGRRRTADG
jgi:hypothetical protein